MSEKPKKDPREGHRARLRDKFLEHGLDKLTEAEVLELLLSFGTPRRDCKLTARAMLERFGTIRDVFEADPGLLAQMPGAGPANIVAIKLIHAISGKYLEQRLVGRSYLTSSGQVIEYLRHSMESLDKELFKVIYLDHNNTVIAVEDLSFGSVTITHVHPREVLERALLFKCTTLIFVHNHPSGNIQPSEDDLRLTRRLVHIAYLAEMKVLDHIIMGKNGEYYSFKDDELLQYFESEVKDTYRLQPLDSGGLLHESNPYSHTSKLISKAHKTRRPAARKNDSEGR